MGCMIAFQVFDPDAEDLAVPGGLDDDELHVTLAHYGEVDDAQFGTLLKVAELIAGQFPPFVAGITGTAQLGEDNPPADTLLVAHPTFDAAHAMCPPAWDDTITVYPDYTPHVTIGYGVPEAVELVDQTVGIKFDRVVVADGDKWFAFFLEGEDDSDDEDDIPEAVGAACGTARKKKRRRRMVAGRVAATSTPYSFTKKQRDKLAASGEAMPDGSYPIRDGKYASQDLRHAITAIGRAKDRAAVEAHIVERAGKLGLSLPPWIGKTAKTAGYRPGVGFLDDADVHHEAIVAAAASRARALATGAAPRLRNPRSNVDTRPGSPFKGKHQKCLHGSPATCRSVKWITAYTALREKRGFSKEKAARIANSMYSHWRSGVPRRRDRRPIIRKRFP